MPNDRTFLSIEKDSQEFDPKIDSRSVSGMTIYDVLTYFYKST
jgi:hypothetical protein